MYGGSHTVRRRVTVMGWGVRLRGGWSRVYLLHVHVTETVKDVPNEAKAPRPG